MEEGSAFIVSLVGEILLFETNGKCHIFLFFSIFLKKSVLVNHLSTKSISLFTTILTYSLKIRQKFIENA